MPVRCAMAVIRGVLVTALAVGPELAATAQEAGAPKTLDEQFVEVNERVPGFGGAYFANGALYVWLLDPSEEALDDAREALVEIVDGAYATGTLVARDANFTFRQLHDWRLAGKDVLNLPGAVFTDVDEKANRVTIGVTDSERNRARVLEALARAGVPEEAVNITESGPVVALAAPVDTRRSGSDDPSDDPGGLEGPAASDDWGETPITLVGAAAIFLALFLPWRWHRGRLNRQIPERPSCRAHGSAA